MRLIRTAAILTLFAALMASARAEQETSTVRGGILIDVMQLPDARIKVVFDAGFETKAFRFRPLPDDYRATHWAFEDDAFVIALRDGVERIERRDGATFSRVVFEVAPLLTELEKDYQPTAGYGPGGVMVYTGHFRPFAEDGRRLNAGFNFAPLDAGNVVAFGRSAKSVENWQSPTGQPGFVYLGPGDPRQTEFVNALVDDEVPAWIADTFYELTPEIFSYLASAFGGPLSSRPDIFLAAPLGEEEGRLSYAGDATPGQIRITLKGRGWTEFSPKALGVFQRATAHEAAHLWQARARPRVDDAPDWIHEGAADAIAAETLLALTIWSEEEYAADFAEARAECAARLKFGSLSSAEPRGDFRALYACGHVLSVAAARAGDTSVASFWRAFIERSVAEEGYSEDTFYALVREKTHNRTFSENLSLFVSTSHGDPKRAIDRLLDAAGRRTALSPLAPPNRR